MKWAPFVMVRITMIFIIGITTGVYLPNTFPIEGCTVSMIILASIYYATRYILKRHTSIRITSGFVGLLFILIAGYVTVGVRDESRRKASMDKYVPGGLSFCARIGSVAERRENSWRQLAAVTHIRTADGWVPCRGHLMIYWRLNERPDTLRYGTSVLFLGKPALVPAPQNPHEFDYRQYLARRNIRHQFFAQPGSWTLEGESSSTGVLYYSLQARQGITSIIDDLIPGDRERAIVKAFTVGITTGIDDDLRQAYAAGGVMHVLAVSGMHVSILYGVLLLLLRPLEKRNGGTWMITVVSLVVLWSYAFVTGLPPSVLRAVGMFSFVALAKPLRRTTSIINTLAASAFFLLMFDPYLILAAGFQLSYLAVLGIVLFYRPIYNLLEPKSSVMNWIWQIVCVSLAAQLATLPVTLYYFHQFPVYFLLANLFVMPLATLILLGGIGLLVVSPLGAIAAWLGKGLSLLVSFLNFGLFEIARLPGSLVYPISITMVQAFCLAGMILAGYLLLQTRRFTFMVVGAVISVVYFVEDQLDGSKDQASFVVYRINRHAAMEWFDHRQSLALVDSALSTDQGKINYHITSHRVAAGVKWTGALNQRQPVNLVAFRSKNFLCIQSRRFQPAVPIKIDYLVIGGNGVKSLETLSRTITFDYVVLDSSNSLWYAQQIVAEAAKLGYRCHSVLTDGAFISYL